MPQVIRCPHCTKSMQVPDNVGGKQVRCPTCSKPFVVPATAVPAPAAPTPVAAAPAPSNRPPSAPDLGNGKGGAAPGPTKCPACGASLLEGAVACMDCGYLLQSE